MEVLKKEQASKSRAPSLTDTAMDATGNLAFLQRHVTNPFGQRMYSFDFLDQAARGIAANFGQVENEHCTLMKDELVALDNYGSGLVPLGRFYQNRSKQRFQFAESVDNLR